MDYNERDTVVLLRDLPEHSLRAGDLGAVVFVQSPDQIEVEFIRASGQTQAVATLGILDVRPVHDHDLIAVRELAAGA